MNLLSDFKTAVFADGLVGRKVLEYLAEQHQRDVAYVVFDDTSSSITKDTLYKSFDIAPCFEWSFSKTGAGLDVLRRHKVDVVLLAWWPHLLKQDYLDLGSKAVLNFHPSLLPHCRGKDPNFWSIREGKPFGVTIHHAVKGMDAGPIAFQKEIALSWEDSGESSYAKSTEAIYELFVENYYRIRAGDIPSIDQNHVQASTHFRKELASASKVNLDETYKARDLLNLLRARTFSGWPACQFEEDGSRYEVRVDIRKVT